MKSRALLSVVILFLAGIAASAQSFRIDWNTGFDVVGLPFDDDITLKGTMVNENNVQKEFLFTYNIDGLYEGHSAALCFGDQCFFLFEGEDDPTLRQKQILTPNGTLALYAYLYPFGVTGTSSVSYRIYDPTQSGEEVSFTVNYYAGTTDVPEAAELGFSIGPNPTSDVVTVQPAEGMILKGANLYSADGSLVRTFGVFEQGLNTFSMSGLASGTYHLLLNLADGSMVRSTIVVQH